MADQDTSALNFHADIESITINAHERGDTHRVVKITTRDGKSFRMTVNADQIRTGDGVDQALLRRGATRDAPGDTSEAANELLALSPPHHRNPSAANGSDNMLVGKAFIMFSEISQLPTEEQAALWNKLQQMAGILKIGPAETNPVAKSTSPNLTLGPSAAADEWEIAPGKLMADDKFLALSASFLGRENVSQRSAQRISPTQWVLNKTIPALNQLSLGPEDDRDCTCSVIRGQLKVKAGDVRMRIGQGGVLAVEKKCIITNVLYKEAVIQVWWRVSDD